MSASTETLVKLRGQTNEGRSKANRTHDDIRYEKHKNKYQYNVRINKVTALNNVQFEFPASGLLTTRWRSVDRGYPARP